MEEEWEVPATPIYKWDPILIIAQICALQSLFYLSASVFVLVSAWWTNEFLSIHFILYERWLKVSSAFSWWLLVVFCLCAVVK